MKLHRASLTMVVAALVMAAASVTGFAAAGAGEAATTAPATVAMGMGEAPMLAALVAAGELPPVEERLPEDPFVREVYGEIGQYGGTIRASTGRIGGAVAQVGWNPTFDHELGGMFYDLPADPNEYVERGMHLGAPRLLYFDDYTHNPDYTEMTIRFRVMAAASVTGFAAAGAGEADPATVAMGMGEAPMLAALVAAGELPPVEERLPEDPFVREVYGDRAIRRHDPRLDRAHWRCCCASRMEPDVRSRAGGNVLRSSR